MRISLHGAIVALGLLAGACSTPSPPEQLSGQTMGTAYSLRLGELPAGVALADLEPLAKRLVPLLAAAQPRIVRQAAYVKQTTADFLELLTADEAGRRAFYERYEFDVSPSTDDAPFFFNYYRWSSLFGGRSITAPIRIGTRCRSRYNKHVQQGLRLDEKPPQSEDGHDTVPVLGRSECAHRPGAAADEAA